MTEHHDGNSSVSAEPLPRADAMQRVMRFVRVVQFRKQYVLGALAVAALLGAVYYFTATRIYEGHAALLVTTTGPDVWTTATMASTARDSRMPTYERLFESAVVLEDALDRIRQLPSQLQIDFAGLPREKWSTALASNLTARGLRNTEIIDVRYRSKSPEAARGVVDAVVQAYLEFMDKHHKDVSVEIIAILNKELHEIDSRRAQKRLHVEEVRRRVGDLNLPENSAFVHPLVQTVIDINSSLSEVQKQRLQSEALLASVRTASAQGRDLRQHVLALDPYLGRQLIVSAMGVTPQAEASIAVTERKLIDDRARLSSLWNHLGPRHPEIEQLQQSIANAEEYVANYHARARGQMQGSAGQELGPMLITLLEQRVLEARGHEQQLHEEYVRAESAAVAMNDRHAELQIAKSELTQLDNLYSMLWERVSNVDIDQNHSHVRVAVVTNPDASSFPVSPRLTLLAAACLGGGLATGLLLVHVMDLIDDRFRSPEEMREQVGAPVLAVIRRLSEHGEHGADALQVHVDPEAVESEAFRTLRAALAFSGQQLERLAITSSQPGDGKTTVLANLGVAYAQAGKRTLLIDADLRRPGLTRLMDLRGAAGLSNVLRSQGDMRDAVGPLIQQSGVEGLQVLPCGPRPSDPAELLSSARMQELVAWAEQNYDQVLIDCPPILAASDAAIVARLLDGIMLVVQPQQNHRRVVMRAAENMLAMGVNLVGMVANRVGEDGQHEYYGFGYGYGYGYGYGEDDTAEEPLEGDDEFADADAQHEAAQTIAFDARRAA